MEQNLEWGLAANGSSGPFYIDVDEVTDSTGTTLWQMQLYFPSTEVSFAIGAPSILVEVLQLFERTYEAETVGWIELGRCFDCPVILAKDDEYNDRYFLHIRGEDTSQDYWQLTIRGDEVTHFTAALRQVMEDLKS